MQNAIILAADVAAPIAHIFRIVSTTEGQRSFWTADCDITDGEAHFNFPQSPMGLVANVTTTPDQLVRMKVTSGFPFWEGSTWEWELSPAKRAPTGTSVLFRHYGFGAGYGESDLGYTAQTWGHILDHLAEYAKTGTPKPFFPAS